MLSGKEKRERHPWFNGTGRVDQLTAERIVSEVDAEDPAEVGLMQAHLLEVREWAAAGAFAPEFADRQSGVAVGGRRVVRCCGCGGAVALAACSEVRVIRCPACPD